MHACEQGWICNSSICMTRRGMKPTGIAIFEAQQKGFHSVAHYVQVPRPPANMLPHTPVSCIAARQTCLDLRDLVQISSVPSHSELCKSAGDWK